ncbi:hypothetical protein KCP71_12850 [Salmonella enterica subsp. enterica]|nr:hypothetical protein KCP71_12850 [Salmonella enterica subsp. enterica]
MKALRRAQFVSSSPDAPAVAVHAVSTGRERPEPSSTAFRSPLLLGADLEAALRHFPRV